MTPNWMSRDAADVGTGEAESLDGDTKTRIQVRVNAESRRVEDAVFTVVGDTTATASAHLVAARLRGTAIDDVKGMDGIAIVAELQLPMHHAGLAALAVEAARRAVADWEQKRRAGP